MNSLEEDSTIEILSIESPNTEFGTKASAIPIPNPAKNPLTFNDYG